MRKPAPKAKPVKSTAGRPTTATSPAARAPQKTLAGSSGSGAGMSRRTAAPQAKKSAGGFQPRTQQRSTGTATKQPASSLSKTTKPLGGLYSGNAAASEQQQQPEEGEHQPQQNSRTLLEQLAEQDSRRNSPRGGDGEEHHHHDEQPHREGTSSVGRHEDLDDMSPESKSIAELFEIRERQHARVRDVLLKYNEDLQHRVESSQSPPLSRSRQRSVIIPSSLSPGGGGGSGTGTPRPGASSTSAAGGGGGEEAATGGGIFTSATIDEAKILEELLGDDEEEQQQQQQQVQQSAEGEGEGEKKGEGEEGSTSATTGEAGSEGENKAQQQQQQQQKSNKKGLTFQVSRTALRAVIKHCQDHTTQALEGERQQQQEFEDQVVEKMQHLEHLLEKLQKGQEARDSNDQKEEEEEGKQVRQGQITKIESRLEELARWKEEKIDSDAVQFAKEDGRIDAVNDRITSLHSEIKEHQSDLDARTRAHAEEATKQAVDQAAENVRELCEQVETGLQATAKCRDDIPQAIVAGIENVESTLHRAMHSEFENQNMRLSVQEEHTAAMHRQNRENLSQEVSKMEEHVNGTLDELKSKYDEAVQKHVDEVREKAEEYELARRSALPIPDSERVAMMQEELENSLSTLKFLTEASSTAMTQTIPPRMERNEQRTAQLEAVIDSQQDELDRLRESKLRFDVAVGPDTLKEAWMGVSTYRAPPPVRGFDNNNNEDQENNRGEGGDDQEEDVAPPPGASEGDEGDENNNNKINKSKSQSPQQRESSLQAVHGQISEALRLIAARNASMSPARAQQGFHQKNHFDGTPRASSFGGADAGSSYPPYSSSSLSSAGGDSGLLDNAGTDVLPADFATKTPRSRLEALGTGCATKRAQLHNVQRVLSNIQHAFHELTMQEADIMSSVSFTAMQQHNQHQQKYGAGAGIAATPRTVEEYQNNRKICDEIAARKQRMYEKERQVVEKRNKLCRELDIMQAEETEIFKRLQQQQQQHQQHNEQAQQLQQHRQQQSHNNDNDNNLTSSGSSSSHHVDPNLAASAAAAGVVPSEEY